MKSSDLAVGGLYRQILKSTSIMGSSFVLRMLITVVRTKLIAVLLGPAGIGLLGLYSSLVNSVATLGNLGLPASGVREVAKATEEQERFPAVRAALWRSSLLLAIAISTALWVFREQVSSYLFNDSKSELVFFCLTIAVALSILADARQSYLTGLHRTIAIARVNVLQPLITTVLVVTAAFFIEETSLLVFVIAVPLVRWVLVEFHLHPSAKPEKTQWREVISAFKPMLKAGLPLMGSAVMVPASLMIVNGLINRNLGVEAVGLYQAAWTISITYVGLVLSGLRVDFIPRVTKISDRHEEVRQLIDVQTEIALLILGPVLIAMVGLAPYVLTILYTSEFAGAAGVLELQVIGNVFKVASLPIGFFLIACGASGRFFFIQLFGVAIQLGIVLFGLNRFGLEVTGVAFIANHAIVFGLLWLSVKRRIGFSWSLHNKAIIVMLLIFCSAIVYCSSQDQLLALALGLVIAAAFGVFSFTAFIKSAESNFSLFRILRTFRLMDDTRQGK